MLDYIHSGSVSRSTVPELTQHLIVYIHESLFKNLYTRLFQKLIYRFATISNGYFSFVMFTSYTHFDYVNEDQIFIKPKNKANTRIF